MLIQIEIICLPHRIKQTTSLRTGAGEGLWATISASSLLKLLLTKKYVKNLHGLFIAVVGEFNLIFGKQSFSMLCTIC
jgi:hypothetical protein